VYKLSVRERCEAVGLCKKIFSERKYFLKILIVKFFINKKFDFLHNRRPAKRGRANSELRSVATAGALAEAGTLKKKGQET
jgi:hypothetical protein